MKGRADRRWIARAAWLGLAVLVGTGLMTGHTVAPSNASAATIQLTPEERLGKRLFFDATLSTPGGQSCGSCHDPRTGFSSPDLVANATGAVVFGSAHLLSGSRKPPSAAYAVFAPPREYNAEEEAYVGGLFLDGRVDTLEQQARLPFLNPVEQANRDEQAVCAKVARAPYARLFNAVYGPGALDPSRPAETYSLIVRAIAAYESSREVNPFSSKYDAYLAGEVSLSESEARGLALFEVKANCAACHPSQPGPNGEPPLFTDFTYDNIGVPRNPANPFYRMPLATNPEGAAFVDRGLGASVNDPAEDGRFKVPTLRNLDKRPWATFPKAYMHNGVFKSLQQVVHFYNARDADRVRPEIEANVNMDELGNLGLTEREERDLVAFLRTLSDGFSSPHSAR